MNAPRQEDETEQCQYEVLFVVFGIVQYERIAFPEQIPPMRKSGRPGESANKIDPEKGSRGKIGNAENYG